MISPIIERGAYRHLQGHSGMVITDENVKPLHAHRLTMHLKKGHIITLPPGEVSKSREMKAYLEDHLLQLGAHKDTPLIALGGGVISDLVGFTASTFMRGAPLILCPTTLIGMVDASIGGKNAINTPLSKNTLGTIYHPQQVIMDIDTLDTLEDTDLLSGLGEMLKHALIQGEDDFKNLCALMQTGQPTDTMDWKPWIERSIAIKQAHLTKNRDFLNFGHTFGHAIEHHTKLPHGIAIAWGMIASISVSELQNPSPLLEPLQRLVATHPTPHWDIEALTQTVTYDKKNHLVLLKGLGQPYFAPLDLNQVKQGFLALKNRF